MGPSIAQGPCDLLHLLIPTWRDFMWQKRRHSVYIWWLRDVTSRDLKTSPDDEEGKYELRSQVKSVSTTYINIADVAGDRHSNEIHIDDTTACDVRLCGTPHCIIARCNSVYICGRMCITERLLMGQRLHNDRGCGPQAGSIYASYTRTVLIIISNGQTPACDCLI